MDTVSSSSVLYTIKPGDSLSHIIKTFYQIGSQDPRYSKVLSSLLFFNPRITNPNQIYPGQTLYLMPLNNTALCSIPLESDTEETNSQSPFFSLQSSDYRYAQSIIPNIPYLPDEWKLTAKQA